MPNPQQIEHAIQLVNDQASFVQRLLVDTLGWPIDHRAEVIEDIAYEWSEKELRAAGLSAKVVGGKAYQIVLPTNPWGIFILEFKNPDVFTKGRGMTSVLRTIVQGLAAKKRGNRDPHLAAFGRDNLLFICNHRYQYYRFAHFQPPAENSPTPPMASFGWGPEDLNAIRTICEFNIAALAWPDQEPSTREGWIGEWSAAFDIERVTKRFYEDYARVFGQVERLIGTKKLKDAEQLRLFTQTLFNRLMLLRFIERKGWLRFPGQEGTKYLATLAAAGGVGRRSLYQARIKPLFFVGLAEHGKQTADAYGTVPMLNGGLFEESALDHKVDDLPDEAVVPIIGAEGLFYRYNFTVEESTPLDIEVAVDPEMLGKVFEELVTGRHETGSYYTPRSVVGFMCREVLKGFIQDHTNAPTDSVRRLVDERRVEDLTDAHAHQISEALRTVKVIDPACGSGAYLLGLLQEIIGIQRTLQSEQLAADPQFLYKRKLHVISQNIYGVDIDPFATQIAKLRLWLSLAVEAAEPTPLPNLDFKIETGDSILGPCDEMPEDLFHSALRARATRLVDLKDKFLVARGKTKADLRAAIEEEETRIARELRHLAGDAVIDWQVHFADVFAKNKGFDIVVANPPYVSALEFSRTRGEEERAAIRARFSTTSGAWDLYVPFFERGIELLRVDGYLAYISPNKYLSASYANALREYMRTRTCFEQLVDLTRFSVFRSASVYPILTFLRKGTDDKRSIVCRLPGDMALADADPRTFDAIELGQATLDLLPDHLWGFLLSNRLDDLKRLLPLTSPMAQLAEVRATTTAAEAETYGECVREGRDSDGFRVVNTGTIDPYTTKWGKDNLTHQGRRFRRPVLRKRDVSSSRRDLYSAPKVLVAKMARRCEAVLDADGIYAGLNINCIARPTANRSLEFICAYCNSSLFMFFYNQLFGALRMSQGYYQFQAPQLRAVPVPNLSSTDDRVIRTLVRDASSAAKNGEAANLREIIRKVDAVIGRLVGLTEAELVQLSEVPILDQVTQGE